MVIWSSNASRPQHHRWQTYTMWRHLSKSVKRTWLLQHLIQIKCILYVYHCTSMPLYVDSYWFNTCRIMSIPIDTFEHWVSLWLNMSPNTQSYILTCIDIDISHSGSNQDCQIRFVARKQSCSPSRQCTCQQKHLHYHLHHASKLPVLPECPHIRLERLCKEPILNEAGWTWHGTAEQPWDMKWIETTQRYSK